MTVARRALGPVLAGILLVGLLLVAALPVRTLLHQRDATATAESELAELRERNAELDQRARRLRDPREIEQLAREEYGLVRPGEEQYVVLPAPAPPPPEPEEGDDDGLLERLWDSATDWL